jgi:hypothetical protein
MLDRLVVLAFSLLLSALTALAPARAQQPSPDTLTAFSNFIKAGNYDNANFYLTNKLVTAEQVDTSQLFFDAFMEKYSKDLIRHAAQIDTLYNYLHALKPIDLNRKFRCKADYRYDYDNQIRECLLASNLFTGANRDAITYFVDRGLDLNINVAGFISPTVPLLVRLGAVYSLDDLNYFVSRGMVLGDELYPIQVLSTYRDGQLNNGQLAMPANYSSMRDQNLLDVMVIALASQSNLQPPQEAARRERLCEFIAYAAPSFKPSFDYLEHVIQQVKEFRGANIDKMERYHSGLLYQRFPTPCVSLVRNMATSHARIENVISRFAGEGDVDTANWLITIRTGQN